MGTPSSPSWPAGRASRRCRWVNCGSANSAACRGWWPTSRRAALTGWSMRRTPMHRISLATLSQPASKPGCLWLRSSGRRGQDKMAIFGSTFPMQLLPRAPHERMPPQRCAQDVRQQIPGGVATGEMRKFMREHRLLLGNRKSFDETRGQTNRWTQQAERDRPANLV